MDMLPSPDSREPEATPWSHAATVDNLTTVGACRQASQGGTPTGTARDYQATPCRKMADLPLAGPHKEHFNATAKMMRLALERGENQGGTPQGQEARKRP